MQKMGFGYLRLPMTEEGRVDIGQVCKMADLFLAGGGSYFDTAYTYLDGGSERALKKSIVERYPREKYRIADKLPTWKLTCEQDCGRFFAEMLERCGVEYFDVLLLHGLDAENYETAKKCRAFEFARRMKSEGRARKIGFSFHDTPELLARILAEQGDIDIVQLQINYLDWDSPSLRARELYEIARESGREIVVMEPIKGGTLARLPEETRALLPQGASPAAWALRFAKGLEAVRVVLSGMSDIQQVEENMADCAGISPGQEQALFRAAQAIRAQTAVPCTGCAYCECGCPKHIPIPHCFAIYNEYCRVPKEDWKLQPAYQEATRGRAKASECIDCGKCEKACPQKISIREHLRAAAKALE